MLRMYRANPGLDTVVHMDYIEVLTHIQFASNSFAIRSRRNRAARRQDYIGLHRWRLAADRGVIRSISRIFTSRMVRSHRDCDRRPGIAAGR